MPLQNFSLLQLIILLFFAAQLAFILYLKKQHVCSLESISERRKARKAWNWILGSFAAFLLVISLLSIRGFFSVASLPPRFLIILLPNAVFGVYLLSFRVSGAFSFLKYFPAALLVGVQFYRFVLEFLVWEFHQQKLVPLEITYGGRSFDFLIGISSLVAAFLLYKKVRHAKKIGVLFNVFGMASMVNIIFIVATSFPSPFRLFETNYLPTFFPGILIPGFIAPFAIYMHLLSLKQLIYRLQQKKRASFSPSL